MLYIDTCSYDDYDKVIKFCLENQIPITDRNKMEMTVCAEMTRDVASQMQDQIDFAEEVSTGETPI